MNIEITVEMSYRLTLDDGVLLTLEAAKTHGQNVIESALSIDNATLKRLDDGSGVGQRIWVKTAKPLLNLHYQAMVSVTRADVALRNLQCMPIHTLPYDVLSCLRPSRFCPSDVFTDFVLQNFGHLENSVKVAAILNWVSAEISYVSGCSTAETTAMDTFVARAGVCRDFAHLTCGLLRAANIPARYVSGYGLGVCPQDFHAVTQVWLEGAWHHLDATGMTTASTFVVIAAGRDAADVAFMETSHWATFLNQSVTVSSKSNV